MAGETKYLDGAGLQYLWGKIVDKIKSSITDSIAVADALIFKGVVSSTKSLPTKDVKTGWTYKVAEVGTYAGQPCEVGDMIIAVSDSTSDKAAEWTIVQNNVDIAGDGKLGLVKKGTGNNVNKFGVDIDTSGAMTVTIGNATYSKPGLMSSDDWTKLNNIPDISGSVGSSIKPIYWNDGPTVCDDTLDVSITGNAATAGHAASADSATTATDATTATKLKNSRTLWGQTFDGSRDIDGSITLSTGEIAAATSLGIRKTTSSGFIGYTYNEVLAGPGVEGGALDDFTGITLGWGANPEKSATSVRINDSTFTYKGNTILHSNNFNEYTPTKTGNGASGTWGISISGNAATATKLNNLLTVNVGDNSVTYDGSSAQTVTIISLSNSDIDELTNN